MTENTEGRPSSQRRAVRLIFQYNGDDVTLISQQDVDIARVSVLREPPPGNYVEVRAADDGPLSRVPIGDVFSTSVEVFPERAEEAIVRVDVDKPSGAFTVVVPASEDAVRVAVLGVRAALGPVPRAEAERSAPEELGVFPLQQAR